ncbi:hypothetical protein QMZ92_02455 [Streptomyces sp. HNM0645]|uniref:hypothetical protein n=1 Tax=Streptomyces sp. HNM0645 TaxID=2782343 RepID=UPI0024B6BD20|nr:hypothetical protein [Streptomyces sp. HNM0645]MDI9883291.1 hypothetical protein [Streptomyces sp. HNM0645]
MIKESFAAYEHATKQAARGGDPKAVAWSEESTQWMPLHQGPATAAVLGKQVRESRNRPDAVQAAEVARWREVRGMSKRALAVAGHEVGVAARRC